jgi:hypothetical protein
VAAISTIVPAAPHLLNPRAPRSLSDITMKLLEKRPEERYPDTGALLRALWMTSGERKSSAWKVPLLPPDEIPPAETPLEHKEEWLSRSARADPSSGGPHSRRTSNLRGTSKKRVRARKTSLRLCARRGAGSGFSRWGPGWFSWASFHGSRSPGSFRASIHPGRCPPHPPLLRKEASPCPFPFPRNLHPPPGHRAPRCSWPCCAPSPAWVARPSR